MRLRAVGRKLDVDALLPPRTGVLDLPGAAPVRVRAAVPCRRCVGKRAPDDAPGRHGAVIPICLDGGTHTRFEVAVRRKTQRVGSCLHLVIRADPASGRMLRAELGAWMTDAGVAGRSGVAIATAVTEAFLNAVAHPLDRIDDDVVVDCELASGQLV